MPHALAIFAFYRFITVRQRQGKIVARLVGASLPKTYSLGLKHTNSSLASEGTMIAQRCSSARVCGATTSYRHKFRPGTSPPA